MYGAELQAALADLKGGTILEVLEEADLGPDAYGFTLPVILCQGKSGTRYALDVLQDPEGNGPGHLEVTGGSMNVERNARVLPSNTYKTPSGGIVMVTPPLDEDYWAFRVRLTERQAVVAFPKFGTFGIGFQVEDEDWNVNLPYQSDTEDIYEHIKVNQGDPTIPREQVLEAIRLLQQASLEVDTGAN